MNTAIQNKPGSTLFAKKGKKNADNKASENELLERIRELEQRVQSDAAQLDSLNKELKSLTYSISHDLRAPLRGVIGYAEILNEDFGNKLGEEGARVIDAIRYNAKKVGSLIDELLSFSRIGHKEIVKEKINMNELMEGVMIDINKLMTHHAEINISNLHSVSADYSMLHLAMFNLVSNAIKFSSKKEKPLIEISSEIKNGEVIFSIKDNGAGFNMEYAGKLFLVFQRLHTEEEFEGAGIGLATVQRIINKHEGRAWAEGKVNTGATFYIAFKKQ